MEARLLIGIFALFVGAISEEINNFEPEHGVYLGELSNPSERISGTVFLVNGTTFQIFNFTFSGKHPDVYFWLDSKDTHSKDGLKVPTFEYAITPLGEYNNQERVVLNIPEKHHIEEFTSLSLYSLKNDHVFATLPIPSNVKIPRSQRFFSELKGSRYSLRSGPIYVIDRRTIKIYGFTFEGNRAPDSYFAVGRGTNIAYDTGVRVAIRGKDVNGITQMTENYRGGKDLIIELPEEYDINHIDWLSVFCYKYRVNFGHVTVPANISSNVSTLIPPYVPLQKRSEDLPPTDGAWTRANLLGHEDRRNFTFQLGPNGGRKGYTAYSHMRPTANVWYVNGFLSPIIYLQRNVTYTFIVNGGNERDTEFYHPLYISADHFGGFDELSEAEKMKTQVFSDGTPDEYVGPLCKWFNDGSEPEEYATFEAYKKTLELKCDKGSQTFTFTPDETTPDLIYYQSAAAFNMGGQIFVVDEMPANVIDAKDEPFTYEEWSMKGIHSTSSSFLYIFSPIIAIFSILLIL